MTSNEPHTTPVISFIIPDYNLPIQLLRECIESIISLELPAEKREIILVDDGSEVSPKEGLGELLSHITLITQENRGLSKARNIGVEAASGEFIQFIDGDDCLLPNYIECFKSIEENDYDMLIFGRVTEKTASFPGKTVPFGSGADYMLHHNICASAWGYIFKRELLSEGLRFTDGILHEDEEFTPLLILNAKKVARYEGAAYFYRQRENSIIHNVEKEHLSQRINDFIGVIERLDNKAKSLEGDAKKALQRRVDQLTMDLVYNVIKLSGDGSYINKALSLLREKGITPLPLKNYTTKYLVFALLMRTCIGRRLLVKYICR